jgi:hypothetical protein
MASAQVVTILVGINIFQQHIGECDSFMEAGMLLVRLQEIANKIHADLPDKSSAFGRILLEMLPHLITHAWDWHSQAHARGAKIGLPTYLKTEECLEDLGRAAQLYPKSTRDFIGQVRKLAATHKKTHNSSNNVLNDT